MCVHIYIVYECLHVHIYICVHECVCVCMIKYIYIHTCACASVCYSCRTCAFLEHSASRLGRTSCLYKVKDSR